MQQKMGDAAEQDEAAFNALVAVNAEQYYTTSVYSNTASWNIRDRHMVETINNLMRYQDEDAKIIVWEHNIHVGDARATDMEDEGMVNVGQLVREQHGNDGVYTVGVGIYSGTVIILPERYDVFLFLDQNQALHPLSTLPGGRKTYIPLSSLEIY